MPPAEGGIGVEVPRVPTEQMREVDRLMIEEYGVSLPQMMENAGRNLARLARSRFLDGDSRGRRVVVLAGTGGNGGGGLVCARHRRNWGAEVEVRLASPASRLAEVSRRQYAILEAMAVPVATAEEGLLRADLLVDALIGYSPTGAPRGGTADLIRAANEHPAPVLALDVPSGIDSTTGAVHEPAVRATATLTLALPKEELFAGDAPEHVGELYLADIGVPPDLYAWRSLGLEVGPVFARDEVFRLR
jgi:NAD(P)H-hydrate epimerase